MSDNFEGSQILELLDSLDVKSLDKSVKTLYDAAFGCRLDDPARAIEHCRRALIVLNDSDARVQLGNSMIRTHAKGRVYLLMASIYLNKNSQKELEQGEKWFSKSGELFHRNQDMHLKSLACFALAVTRRKLHKYELASVACENAQTFADYESVPTEVNMKRLRAAIQEERKKIQSFSLEEQRFASPKTEPQTESETEKMLSVFPISAGTEFVAKGGTTDLNFLSKDDYDRHAKANSRVETIDLREWSEAHNADYILEIDDGIKFVDNDLKSTGTWLFIKTETDPERLKGKTVACVIKKKGKLFASLKVFSSTDDHYFLKAKQKGAASTVIVHYDTRNYKRILKYYERFGTVERSLVYDVRISGEVVGWINQPPAKPFNWNFPIIDDIAAGLSEIADKDIVDYTDLSASQYPDVDFGVEVIGDSMEGDGIFEGDIALIHADPEVKNREITAVVIETSIGKKIGVLKRYYEVCNKNDELRHWLLESSNSNSRHLIVIPVGSNEIAIKSRYDNLANAGKINLPKYYTNASVVIAGKYVGSIKRE